MKCLYLYSPPPRWDARPSQIPPLLVYPPMLSAKRGTESTNFYMTSHTQDKCSNQTTVTVNEGSFVHFFQLRLNWVFMVAHLDSSYVTTGWGTSWCHRPLGYPAGICWLPRYKSTKQREEKISSLKWKGKKRHKQFKQDNSAALSNRLGHLSTNS